jgi:hypothetical protein
MLSISPQHSSWCPAQDCAAVTPGAVKWRSPRPTRRVVLARREVARSPVSDCAFGPASGTRARESARRAASSTPLDGQSSCAGHTASLAGPPDRYGRRTESGDVAKAPRRLHNSANSHRISSAIAVPLSRLWAQHWQHVAARRDDSAVPTAGGCATSVHRHLPRLMPFALQGPCTPLTPATLAHDGATNHPAWTLAGVAVDRGSGRLRVARPILPELRRLTGAG